MLNFDKRWQLLHFVVRAAAGGSTNNGQHQFSWILQSSVTHHNIRCSDVIVSGTARCKHSCDHTRKGQAAVSGVYWNIMNFSCVCWCYFLNIVLLRVIDVIEKTWPCSILAMVNDDVVLQHGGNGCGKFVEVSSTVAWLLLFVATSVRTSIVVLTEHRTAYERSSWLTWVTVDGERR